MTEVKSGGASSEFKIVALNYMAGLALVAAGTWLQHKGQDATALLTMGTTLLLGNGVAYGAMRTSHKNTAVKAANTPTIVTTP
tara:strand:+ start:192 stop:440 length:249 start_codon:yes stop_codon:yes gene_type:complete